MNLFLFCDKIAVKTEKINTATNATQLLVLTKTEKSELCTTGP